jgi:hypothetical protein
VAPRLLGELLRRLRPRNAPVAAVAILARAESERTAILAVAKNTSVCVELLARERTANSGSQRKGLANQQR